MAKKKVKAEPVEALPKVETFHVGDWVESDEFEHSRRVTSVTPDGLQAWVNTLKTPIDVRKLRHTDVKPIDEGNGKKRADEDHERTTVGGGHIPTKRSVGWRWRSINERYGVLFIANGVGNEYLVRVITATTFQLTKLEIDRETTYTVGIGKTKRCGCDGFAHRNHCKHVEALSAMREKEYV